MGAPSGRQTHIATKQLSVAFLFWVNKEASAWPANENQTGLNCVVEAAAGDDSWFIVYLQNLVLRVVCNYIVWVKCGGRVRPMLLVGNAGCSFGCASTETERSLSN